MVFCKIANVSCAKYDILWMSHVFAFLSFPPTTINPHWSRLAWIYVHPEKILGICSPRKNLGYMFTQKKGKYWCTQSDIERGCQEFIHHVKDRQEFTHHVKDLSESYSDFDKDSTRGVVHWSHLPDEFLRWFQWILNFEHALGDFATMPLVVVVMVL